MRGMLVTGGLLSLLVAAGLMLTQRDYKRLLAYSSIEHMGLMALAAAAGGMLATTALLREFSAQGIPREKVVEIWQKAMLPIYPSTEATAVRQIH